MDYKNNIARYIGRLNHLISQKLNQKLFEEQVGITTDQFRLLTVLWENDGITQQQLALALGRDRASVTRMVDILEEQKIIVRSSDEADKRTNVIFLTKKGKMLETSASRCAKAILDNIAKGMTAKEETLLKELLLKAIRNLQN